MLKNMAQIARETIKTTPELSGPLSGPWTPAKSEFGSALVRCVLAHNLLRPPKWKFWIRPCRSRYLSTWVIWMRCLRVTLGVQMGRVKNEEIRQRLNIPNTICEDVSRRRMEWFGHVVSGCHITVSHYKHNDKNDFTQRRPPGRPPTRWRDQIQGPGRFGSTSSGGWTPGPRKDWMEKDDS